MALELDLTDLVSADAAGIEALQRIRAQGATLVGAPGYIQLKLDSAAGAARPRPTRHPAGQSRQGALTSRPGRDRARLPPARRDRHAQLLHAEPQRVRMDAEAFGGVARAVDPPAAALQHRLDVQPLHVVEIVGGAGRERPAG